MLHQCETGANVDVIYLDFAKAFDKVDHSILLSKIRNMGIGGKVGIWLYAFLKNRYQVTVTNKSMSVKSNVISGVPQGNVLGPVLFLIMISDIDTDITTSVVSSFADDTRVSKTIGSPDDTEVLQQDLNKIYTWTERNNMQFNDDKFELMRYGTDTEIKNQTCYKGPDKSLIKEKQSVKDLGVYMNTNLTFGTHIDKMTVPIPRNTAHGYSEHSGQERKLLYSHCGKLMYSLD